jgi:(p)ppGpp synthase/HD superfamily hydrolase
VIHRRDCDNVHDSPEPERWVEIDWGPEVGRNHAVQIEVEADDRAALLPTLVKLVGSLGAKVLRSDSHRSDDLQRIRLQVSTQNATQLATLLQRLGGAAGVYQARLVES